ncbi:phosphatidylinositol N-acetylglucosaminyltransferase subunit P-like isoform X2 [Leptotrombidium deliense]|uniref:Phosphatidylinositol N-acetylglucosaminyltransferase subunit P-like isoform X2 n=1 Tax=Leptotrombidium deliense TaxID=299467 RepID=A0A443ST24_9ACAR|nr:phosphatidylinositol N-acetylglucosaminyltransferase subunit P-like isoform X2 [Leptotrombidium deliense]
MNEEASPSPNVNRSVYGYVLFLVSNSALLIYFIRAFIDDGVLLRFGVTCLPSRYWCLALPLYFSISVVIFALFFYPAINCILTKRLNCKNVITDNFSKPRSNCESGAFGAIAPIYDMSIEEVCVRTYIEQKMFSKIVQEMQ